jgi:hypothetical protein
MNYETKAIRLWLDNDEGTQRFTMELAEKASSIYELSQMLKDEVEENNPLDNKPSMYSDLLNSAISKVNWYDLAEVYWPEDKPKEGVKDDDEG